MDDILVLKLPARLHIQQGFMCMYILWEGIALINREDITSLHTIKRVRGKWLTCTPTHLSSSPVDDEALFSLCQQSASVPVSDITHQPREICPPCNLHQVLKTKI